MKGGVIVENLKNFTYLIHTYMHAYHDSDMYINHVYILDKVNKYMIIDWESSDTKITSKHRMVHKFISVL